MQSVKSTVAFVPREVFSTTMRALDTLYERTPTPFELVCVDGNSPPPVRSYLEQASHQRGFTLLRTDQYLTPNQARNLAIQYVHTPYVVFVDNDAIVAPDWLEPLERCAEETGAWVVGPLYFEHEPELHRLHMAGGECSIRIDDKGRRYYHERHHHPHQPYEIVDAPLERCETELIEFHTVLVTMETFKRIGPLDEGLCAQSEHGDLCLSVCKAGGKVYLEPASCVTYIPPRRLEPADRECFLLRWSEARTTASLRRLIEKWDLDPDHPSAEHSLNWVRSHRRHGSSLLAHMRKLFGRKLTNSLRKRLRLDQLEVARNLRMFPPSQYGVPSTPEVKVVHRPPPKEVSALQSTM